MQTCLAASAAFLNIFTQKALFDLNLQTGKIKKNSVLGSFCTVCTKKPKTV